MADKVIVTIAGVFGIIFVYWFFLMKKEHMVEAGDSVDVEVKGGYSPAVIAVVKNKPTTINFLRTDDNSCLEEVVIPEFKIRQYLPVGQKVSVSISPAKAGDFPFSCGMGMYHGKIIVK